MSSVPWLRLGQLRRNVVRAFVRAFVRASVSMCVRMCVCMISNPKAATWGRPLNLRLQSPAAGGRRRRLGSVGSDRWRLNPTDGDSIRPTATRIRPTAASKTTHSDDRLGSRPGSGGLPSRSSWLVRRVMSSVLRLRLRAILGGPPGSGRQPLGPAMGSGLCGAR